MAAPTIVARLSPPGKSAIACLGIVGPRGWEVVRTLFRRVKNKPLPEAPNVPAVYFGSFGDPALGSDEVILYVRSSSNLEVHCHGGVEVVRLLEATLAARDVQPAAPQAWAEAVHGSERAAMLDIVSRCPTLRTAAIALDQLHGAFGQAIAAIETMRAAGDIAGSEARRQRLLALAPVGEHLTRPWTVAIAGAPNVGKSSLVNALAGYTRSIVSPTPGTTRDVVATTLAFDGWPVELLDTAGLRDTADPLESAGVQLATAAHAEADLVVWVIDATAPTNELPPEGALVVINKVDCVVGSDGPGAIRTSAVTNAGIDDLMGEMVRRLIPHAPERGEAIPITPGQRALVERFR